MQPSIYESKEVEKVSHRSGHVLYGKAVRQYRGAVKASGIDSYRRASKGFRIVSFHGPELYPISFQRSNTELGHYPFLS